LAETAVPSEDAASQPPVSKAVLASALFRIGSLRFGRFTLSSGKTSAYYLDLRMVPSFPEVYSLVVSAYREMVLSLGESKFDLIAGVATAGVAFSSPLAFLLKKPMVYVRREEKGHGLGRLVEGAVRPGLKALVVDDLATTGGSLISAVEALRREAVTVSHAAVLVDRLEGGSDSLRDVGVKLRSYASVTELVDSVYGAGKMTKKDYESVMKQVRGAR
jgi:orotate phosphoribosyltransferase